METNLPKFSNALAALALIGVLSAPALAEGTEEAAPQFTKEFLSDPKVNALGREIWEDQCQFCHGKNAYPGKAPKLKPRKYTPEFVYKRVTKGFKGMPAWAEVYDQDERMAVTAWIKNKDFSN